MVNGTFGKLTEHFEREKLNQYGSVVASLIGPKHGTQTTLGMLPSDERKIVGLENCVASRSATGGKKAAVKMTVHTEHLYG